MVANFQIGEVKFSKINKLQKCKVSFSSSFR